MAAPPPPGWSPRPSARSPAPVAQPRPIEGTPYFYTVFAGPTELSGAAVGAVVAGAGSVLVSFAVACSGVVGASGGWGAAVAGAFAILSILAGGAAVALGVAGRGQVKRGAGRLTGRAAAVTGIILGTAGTALALLSLVLALLL